MTRLTPYQESLARKRMRYGSSAEMLPPEMSDAEIDAIDREKLAEATGIVRKYLPRLIAWALIFGAIVALVAWGGRG
jgi:hypothetical protein